MRQGCNLASIPLFGPTRKDAVQQLEVEVILWNMICYSPYTNRLPKKTGANLMWFRALATGVGEQKSWH